MENQNQTTIENPRLSMLVFARYCTAHAAERERLLRDCKFPPAFRVAYYNESRASIRQWLLGGGTDSSIFESRIARISNDLESGDHTQREVSRLNNNIGVLNNMIELEDNPVGNATNINSPESTSNNLVIEGVTINVNPDVITRHRSNKHDAWVGAVCTIITSSVNITSDETDILGALMYTYLRNFDVVGDGEEADYKKCITIDACRTRIYSGPGGIVRTTNIIEAACREIALIWPTLN